MHRGLEQELFRSALSAIYNCAECLSLPAQNSVLTKLSPRSALVGVLSSYSADVMRVDLASGRRGLFKKIGPSDPAGVALYQAVFTPDGKYYAYSCGNELSQLYLVEGLR